MKLIKKITAFILALVMMMSLLAVNSSAASIKKIEIVQLPTKTTFYHGTDWDYGYWKFPEGDGFGVFEPRDGLITFMHGGGYFSKYQDRGVLDLNGLIVKVTYSDGKTKQLEYKETLYSNGVLDQNILALPKGGEYKLGENTIEIFLPENYDVYTTYKINIVAQQFGDVNNDGAVNSTDALVILQHSVKLITLTSAQFKVADMTGDGAVNSVDALQVLKICVGL